ncbi:unnamed protein product [Closterium sp. Naga37s-1]|nr:unnamed protein product [Closterium sp. Naga37s-1]
MPPRGANAAAILPKLELHPRRAAEPADPTVSLPAELEGSVARRQLRAEAGGSVRGRGGAGARAFRRGARVPGAGQRGDVRLQDNQQGAASGLAGDGGAARRGADGSREMEELRAEALTPLLLQQMAEEEEEERAREGDEEEAVNPVNPVNSTSTERSPWEGLVRLHSVYEDNWGVHLVMDHCSGGDLFDLVDRYAESAGMPEQLAAAVVGQLAATLAWMHSVGVVHRDLKPENILLARPFSGDASSFPNLHLCIADFGLARRLAPGEHLTGLVGSPFYLAPEVVKGHLYDHQVDVWSLGIILYTCLSGKLPFHGPNHNAVFAAACRAAPDLVSPELWGGVSAEAKDLVRRMLQKEPGRRIRSATANAAADPNHLTTPPQDDATSSHSPTPPRPTPPRPLSICPPPPPSPRTLATCTTPTPRTPSRALSARPRKPTNQSPRPAAPSPPALPPSLLTQLRADRVADLMRLFQACQAGSSDDVARCQGSRLLV